MKTGFQLRSFEDELSRDAGPEPADPHLREDDEYESSYEDLADYRESIHPKKESQINFKTYFQVFEEKNGFLKNLSILDLLFNQGPQSSNYLI